MIRSRLLLAVLASLAAAGLVAACGSGGGSSGQSDSQHAARQSASAAPSADPIKVGLICNCSGTPGAVNIAGANVARAWAKSVNAAGGLNGHPIELTVKDDKSNPGTSVTAAKQLISADVDVILDLSVLDSTWAKDASAAKIPVVGGVFNTPAYYTDPNFFPSGQTNDSTVYSVVATAKQAGAANIGLLYCAEAPVCQESVSQIKAAGKKLHLPMVYSASVSATAPNYTAQCLAAKQAGVSAFLLLESPPIFARIVHDCHLQGFDPIYIEEGTGYSNIVRKALGKTGRLWAQFPILPFFADTPAVAKMNAVVDKYYPGLRADERQWSQFGPEVWTGALVIEAGIRAAGIGPADDITAAKLTDGLTSLQNETLGGWSPPLTFEPGKPHPVHCWFTAYVTNGQPAMANHGNPTCEQ